MFLGVFGANGWTGMLTAAAGGLLLFGAAQHLLAKTMSLIVGIALSIAAVVALVSGNMLGMAAANIWTEIHWGGSAAILLFNTAIPRRKKTITDAPTPAREQRQDVTAPAPAQDGNGAGAVEAPIGAPAIAG